MKNKILILFLMSILTIASCSPDKIEPNKICGTITNMGFSTDDKNINHFFIEVNRQVNVYEAYEVSKSEFDSLLSTYLINCYHEVKTEGCFIPSKLIISRVTNTTPIEKWTEINILQK